ncbi:MAG: Fic family protein [Bacteroidales bacterium]|nr:Fic family protein [Bacteroidales bacterium]
MFDRNKPYNDLPSLPPEKVIKDDPDILKKLVSASRALSSVNNAILTLPNPYMLINTISIKEVRSSTEVENILTTEDDLFKAISDSKKEEETDQQTREVLRYREALWTGYNAVSDKGKFSQQTIINIFRQIKSSRLGIRPPHARVIIRRGNSDHRPGEVAYTPPRGEGIIEAHLDNLIKYLNDEETDRTDPLIKMCIAHYQFEAIHPFQDGNGRTGRILNLLYLVKTGLLLQPVLYLSKYIIENKESYYYHLAIVNHRKDWKSWILFMLDAVEKTSVNTGNLISDIVHQMDETYKYASERINWYNRDLNEVIFSQPYIKAKTVGELMKKTSRTTITKYMGQLLSEGILSSKKEGLEVYYLNDDLIRILGGN